MILCMGMSRHLPQGLTAPSLSAPAEMQVGFLLTRHWLPWSEQPGQYLCAMDT